MHGKPVSLSLQPCLAGAPGTSLFRPHKLSDIPLRTLNDTGQEQEFKTDCRTAVSQGQGVFGTANSPIYRQGTGTLASGVPGKGAELD